MNGTTTTRQRQRQHKKPLKYINISMCFIISAYVPSAALDNSDSYKITMLRKTSAHREKEGERERGKAMKGEAGGGFVCKAVKKKKY